MHVFVHVGTAKWKSTTVRSVYDLIIVKFFVLCLSILTYVGDKEHEPQRSQSKKITRP